ncbi:MAG: enoyl-CoA hydratase/isomerase family protein [Dongiaceae bacterium]
MTCEFLTTEIDERVAVITLNRPERYNALNESLCRELKASVERLDGDPSIRVIVLTGAGEKAFCVGYDIKDADEAMKEDIGEWAERLRFDLEFTSSLWRCSKPVIAMIDGYCLAGGLELAQMADIRYCSDRARFGVVETRFSAGISTLAMPYVIGARCRELIYTGDMVDADEALRLGLVSRCFAAGELRAATMKIAHRMSQVALSCLQWNKRALNNAADCMGFQAALNYGVTACTIMDSIRTPEFIEFDRRRRESGLKAALKWRDEQFSKFE